MRNDRALMEQGIDNLKKAGVKAAMEVYHSNMHAFDMMKPEGQLSKTAAEKFNQHFEYAVEHYFADNS